MKHPYIKRRHLYTSILCGCAFAALLISLRDHIQDLVEVARTYSTFHQYIQNHPEVLHHHHRPNSSLPQTQTDPRPRTPKIIHQILLQENDPPSGLTNYTPAISSCRSLHPAWQHRLWTDESATPFIATHYPSLLAHYTGYKQRIQRANILRYAVLHHEGGLYLDLDITCKTPLDDLLHVPFLTAGAHPAGVNNAFVVARPGHGFLAAVLEGVGRRDLGWGLPYVENMLSTGCMFLSNRWMGYVRKGDGIIGGREEDRVYVLADEEGKMEPHMLRGSVETPLFLHGGASSWHGWDAAGIVFVGDHLRVCLAVVVSVAVGSVFLIWKLITRYGRRQRRHHRKQVESARLLG